MTTLALRRLEILEQFYLLPPSGPTSRASISPAGASLSLLRRRRAAQPGAGAVVEVEQLLLRGPRPRAPAQGLTTHSLMIDRKPNKPLSTVVLTEYSVHAGIMGKIR